MSIESIIGITSGIIGIITSVIAFVKWGYPWYIKKFVKFPYAEVFNEMTRKDSLDEKRRKYLRKLNESPYFKDRIKEEYIRTFELNKRGKEDVLLEICESNDIEPTADICKETLGYNSDPLKNKYQEHKKKVPTLERVEPIVMDETKVIPIHESEGKTVYLSELLKTRYPATCDRLTQILEKHHVNYKFLKGTKDIWCRDYMPVQTKSGKLVQFKYDPSYLKDNKEWEESRSDVREVCKANGFEPQFSDINLDGGNVLICDDRAILSNRIFSENPDIDKEKLINELSKLLECEIIIIPAENDDMTGHADGMVRFVNKNTILGNTMAEEYKYWQDGMQKVIDKYNLKYIDVPFFVPKDPKYPYSAVGIYVNYLEVNNLIVMPVFGREEDQKAFDAIQKAFPDRVIEKIDYNDVAQEGGLLNCTTWVVKK
jgi:agmatine/peptidylarginine deiminase